ncbi:MAG: group II intron reverse transcriptase/maturase [Synergistaceae bacterium]|nr:group II intron reverse transcriptase/maturase [Synergistaceae bacterium]
MLEQILSSENLNSAYAKIAQNKSTYGVDGMTAEELFQFLEIHWESLKKSLLDGTYKPQPVKAVKIPKSDGKFRTLGIPTVTDRFIQRAIMQILMPLYENIFSEASYGFRPERSIEDAAKKSLKYINGGYDWAVDMDLEKFFDSVNREKLIEILIRDIYDKRVLKLIISYINSDVVSNGRRFNTNAGIHQGGPLSPLLANIMLNELDKELTKRREFFVRYADDMMIFCRNEASARQALKHITPYIEQNLFLKINREKTFISHAENVKFLGYGFFRTSGGYKIKIHPNSIAKMKNKIMSLARNNESEKIQKYFTAWITHYRLADIDKFLYDCREWLRLSVKTQQFLRAMRS